jgi:hypothetical protein
MGDMAEMYDYWHEPDDNKPTVKDIRGIHWTTKDKREIKIGDMTDSHLLHAYKLTMNNDLFIEMVVRLFEDKVKEEKQ